MPDQATSRNGSPDWNDPTVPCGNAPPLPLWPMWLAALMWVGWIGFLIAMVLLVLKSKPD
jgi:hypothetical protein